MHETRSFHSRREEIGPLSLFGCSPVKRLYLKACSYTTPLDHAGKKLVPERSTTGIWPMLCVANKDEIALPLLPWYNFGTMIVRVRYN